MVRHVLRSTRKCFRELMLQHPPRTGQRWRQGSELHPRALPVEIEAAGPVIESQPQRVELPRFEVFELSED